MLYIFVHEILFDNQLELMSILNNDRSYYKIKSRSYKEIRWVTLFEYM